MIEDHQLVQLDMIVGTVREIKGTAVIIRMFENSGQLFYFYNGIKYSGVVIGSFVGIKRNQYTIIGKVEKEYAFDTLNNSSLQEFKKERFVREIEIKVVGSINDKKYITGMIAFPQLFNDVVLLSEEQKLLIIQGDRKTSGVELSNSLEVPKMIIGKLWPDGVEYNLKWYELFNSHIAIFGNTGSGKSNTLAKIYHELFKLDFDKKVLSFNNSKFVILDFNGEYVERECITNNKTVIKLSTGKATQTRDVDFEYFIIPKARFWKNDMLSVLFGATEQTQQPFLTRVLDYYFKNERDFEKDLPTFISQAFVNVYIVSNKYSLDLLKQVIELVGLKNDDVSRWINLTMSNNSTGSFFSNEKIEEWNESNHKFYWNIEESILIDEKYKIENALENKIKPINNSMKCLQIATYLKMIFELRFNTVQYDHIAPLLHRIEARVNDFSKVFKIKDDDNLTFEKSVTVISLKDVNQDMKMIIPLVIAKVTYDSHKGKNSKNEYFNLIVDEAHNILSESSKRESEKWKDYRLEVFEEIIKEGRKFNYFLTIASQRPADISPTIVSQVHNYFIHRLVNDNDLRLLDNTLSSLDKVSKESIPNLSPGQVILTGVLFDLPIIVKIDILSKEFAPNSWNIPLLNVWLKKSKIKE